MMLINYCIHKHVRLPRLDIGELRLSLSADSAARSIDDFSHLQYLHFIITKGFNCSNVYCDYPFLICDKQSLLSMYFAIIHLKYAVLFMTTAILSVPSYAHCDWMKSEDGDWSIGGGV